MTTYRKAKTSRAAQSAQRVAIAQAVASEAAKPAPLKAHSSITVIGRRWFQRGPGNTYHTAEILVDGVTVHKTGKAYGYGSQYEESAAEWLAAQGIIERKESKNGSHDPLWRIVRDVMGLNWQSTALDVSRERDL